MKQSHALKLAVFLAAVGCESSPEREISNKENIPSDPEGDGKIYVLDQAHLRSILENYFNPENRPPLRMLPGQDSEGNPVEIEVDPVAEWNKIVAELNLDFSRFVQTEEDIPDYDSATRYFNGSFAPTREIVFDAYFLKNGTMYTGFVGQTVSGQVTNYTERRPNLAFRPLPQIGGVFPVRSHIYTGAVYTGPSLAADRWMAHGVNLGRYTITGTDPAIPASWGWRTAWNNQWFNSRSVILTYPDNCCEVWNNGQPIFLDYSVFSRVGITQAIEVTLRVVGETGMISSNFPRLVGDTNLGLMASSENMGMRTVRMTYAAENKTVSARYMGVLAQLNNIACPVMTTDGGKKCEFNLQTVYEAERMAGRVTDNLARVEIVLNINRDYLDRTEFGDWVCTGMGCNTPWGRTGRNREGMAIGWIRSVIGNANYHFVQLSRGNDDSPAAGRPGDGELNLSAIQNAIGQIYPQTIMPNDCRNQLAVELTRKLPMDFFFANKLALLNQTASNPLNCPAAMAAVPAAQRVLFHLIENDNSAYEVTAQTYAFGFNGNQINTGALIEFTSGRYANVPAMPAPGGGGSLFKFCAELTAQNVMNPTVCGVPPPCPMRNMLRAGTEAEFEGEEECEEPDAGEEDAGELEADSGDPYWEPVYPDAEVDPPFLYPDASTEEDPDVGPFAEHDAAGTVEEEDAGWIYPWYDAGENPPPYYDAGENPPWYDAGEYPPPPYADAGENPPWYDAGENPPPPYADAGENPPYMDASTTSTDADAGELDATATHIADATIAGARRSRTWAAPPAMGDVLSGISDFMVEYPPGVTERNNFLDQRGAIDYAAVNLRIGDLTNPPHGGNYNLHLVVYNVEGRNTRVWKRCRAQVRVHNGALELVQWFDCERLQFWNLVPIRTNIPNALNTARVRPATFRYRKPPRDPCLANEVVGMEIEHSGQFGILLRHGSDGTNNRALCQNCHQDTPMGAPAAGALFCQGLPPPPMQTFGNGSAMADDPMTMMVNEGPTNARNPAMKPMDNGAVLPLVRYLMGRRSPVVGNMNFNEYLRRSGGMNRHIHDFNKWFCANMPTRYSRFPGDMMAIPLRPQPVTDAYFRLVTNGDATAWTLATAVAACMTLPMDPPATR